MDDRTQQLVFALICPLVIAGALLAPGLLRKSDDGREPWPIRIPLAISLPPLLAFLALYGWPSGSDTWRTAAFAPMLGLGAAVILAFVRHPWAQAAATVVVAGALTLLLRPYTRPEHWTFQVLPGVATMLLVGIMEPLASRRRGPSLTFPLGIAVGSATGLVLLSGFMKLSLPMSALSFSMLILALYSLRRRDLSLASGAMFIILPTTLAAVFIAFLEAKFQKSPIPPVAFALVAFAPLALWLGELRPVRSRRPWVGVVLRVVLVLAVCATGMTLAVTAKRPEPKKDPYADLYKDMLGK